MMQYPKFLILEVLYTPYRNENLYMRKMKLFTIQRKADKYTLAYFVSKKDCVEYLNRFIVAQFLDHYKS